MDICFEQEPAFVEVKPGHWVACFLAFDELGLERQSAVVA